MNKQPTTRAKPLPKHRPTATQAATRSRSLLSRSRVSRAVEAARRVGGGLIDRRLIVAAAHNGEGSKMQKKPGVHGPDSRAASCSCGL